MRLCAELNTLVARVDRVLQSADTSGGVVVIEKEEWSVRDDVIDYVRALRDRPGAQIFRVGKSNHDDEWFHAMRFPSSWIHNTAAPRTLSVFDTTVFPHMYMVFGEGVNCLLFMRSAAPAIVLEAKLETIKRRFQKKNETPGHLVQEEKPKGGDLILGKKPKGFDPRSGLYDGPTYAEVTEVCTVEYFLRARKTFVSGIAFDADSCNTYNSLRIDGSHAVVEYTEYDGQMKVGDFVLTYLFKTQSSDAWDTTPK